MLATVLPLSFDKRVVQHAGKPLLCQAFGPLHCKGLPLPPPDQAGTRGKENFEAKLAPCLMVLPHDMSWVPGGGGQEFAPG